jgi:O-antigen ligase
MLGFGYGKRQIPGQLESTYRERLEKIGYGVAGHGHNLILNIWLQTGLVGLIAFLALLVAMTRYLLDSLRGSENISCGGTIGVSVMVALLTKNMTDDFLGQAIAVYFWLLMGVAAGLHHAPRSTERD